MGWAIDCIEVGMGWDMCLVVIVVVIIISRILIVLGLAWGWDMCLVIIVVVIIISPRCGDRMLIDRAGCKGLRQGGAAVSEAHANFLVTDDGAKARDVIALMERVEARVRDTFGVTLEREVVVWTRHDGARTSAGEDCR